MRLLVFVAFCSLAAAPALAQSAYVSGSILADVTRVGRTEIVGVNEFPRGDGETFGFALRLGTSLGDRWGVEVEFVRPSAIENEVQPRIIPVLVPLPGIDIRPTIQYDIRLRQRITSLTTLAWLRQYVAEKVDFVYLAGIGFHHVAQETRVEFDPRLALPVVPVGSFISVAFPSIDSVVYWTGPVVGLEARIALTNHVTFVPGVRLSGMVGALVIRTGAGIGWSF